MSSIKTLQQKLAKVELSFKEEIGIFESTVKENSLKVLEYENQFTALKSDIDNKVCKYELQNKENYIKTQQLEELFNEMYSVIKKHSMQEKMQNMQQINQSTLYNAKENKQEESIHD